MKADENNFCKKNEGSFSERVYAAVKRIPKGKVAGYALVAFSAGSPNACRAVGNALHKNPYFGIVPCHRVVASDGSLAGKFAFGGSEVQQKMLEAEGVFLNADGKVDMKKYSLKTPF